MSLTTKNQPIPFIGNDLRGTFTFNVTGLDGYTPTMVNGIYLRLVGKANEADTDAEALFDINSSTSDENGSNITIDTNDGEIVTGTFYIDGVSTENLTATSGNIALLYYAFSARYTGDSTENIYLKGTQQLRTDTVIDR
jgi:hypothetical protein